MKWALALWASVFILAGLSSAEVCRYGLAAKEGECSSVERDALQRIASAKTICYSANSQVQWSKNNKQPVGAFEIMRVGARIAMKGLPSRRAMC